MKNKTQYKLTFVGLLLSLQLLIVPGSFAHEPRTIADGGLNVAVGWRTEPAFDHTVNAFDLIINSETEVPDPDIMVKALYLKKDSQDAKVIASARLKGDLRRDRTNPNRFNISFRPTRSGAYGFHIKGMIAGLMVDEVFICRGGTQNTDGRAFGCVEKAQDFPKGKKRHKHDD